MEAAKKRIALIAGGVSGEREVSLSGAAGIESALDPNRFEIVRYDPATDLVRLAGDAPELDFAFILLHGLFGEDGTMQGFLDLLGVPYQGAGVLGSAVAMDKHLAKELYLLSGLPVAPWEIVKKGESPDLAALEAEFSYPMVIKPIRLGSSLGLCFAHSRKELQEGLIKALSHDTEVMVEQYIKGRELTVGVLGNESLEALPVIEIIPGEGFQFFDYEAKYKPGASEEICPAEIDEEMREKVQSYAVRAHKVLRLRGYSRTDLILAPEGEAYLLETNTIPGMTPTSLMPRAAAAYGLSLSAFLERLIELGLEGREK